MTSPCTRACLAVALALALGPLAAEEPLRDEDIVRMFVAGRSSEEIIRSIRQRDVDFDLDPDMIEELKLAGLPEPVIRAMKERQAELHPPEEPVADVEDAPAAPDAGPLLTVKLIPPTNEEREGTYALLYPAILADPALAEEHGFGDDPRTWEVTELAVFLACRTSDHVPDQWRSKSPLGRDFVRMPRHRLLAFHSGAEPVEAEETLGRVRRLLGRGNTELPVEFLRLDLPDSLSANVEADVAHDLVLGMAVNVRGRYLALVIDEKEIVPAGDLEMDASVWSEPRRGRFILGASLDGPPADEGD